MAKLVSFFGTTFATSQTETFVGNGGSDTVSYALVGTGVNIGDYTSGISVNLATGVGSFGWALGDTYVGVENLVGSQHSDVLIGNYQANILDGGGSPDTIYAGGGADTVLGAGGFDFLYGEAGNDVMDGQWQTDKLYGGDGDDRIWGGSNYINHFYPGTNYADVLYGGGGNDQLRGDVRVLTGWTEYDPSLDFMPGADELHGGSGNDRLNGDGGNDTLWGDTGADTFEFDTRYVVKAVNGSSFAITPGGDVIKDFRPWEGDRLDLNGQAYTVADNSAGYLIITAYGLILLEGIHSFTSDWVVL
jgi:Ca2+-binding RTX toxin-like protein